MIQVGLPRRASGTPEYQNARITIESELRKLTIGMDPDDAFQLQIWLHGLLDMPKASAVAVTELLPRVREFREKFADELEALCLSDRLERRNPRPLPQMPLPMLEDDKLTVMLTEAIPRAVALFEARAATQQRADAAKTIERLCAASVNAPAGVRDKLDATIAKLLGELADPS